MEFLNLEGSRIVLAGNSLAQSLQDNGISKQSEKFDYLLDLDDNIIAADDGELYVPISYMRDGSVQVGDGAVISGKEFTVAGFLRDSQMNSTLASSKRFLVSENDFEELRCSGSIEYLIEFRLYDLSALGAFESAYNAAGLEANGPTITYPLFRLINSISDGMMIAVILLVRIMVVLIAFVCIRFTLLANTLGQSLAGLAISYVGASSFSFTNNPVLSYLLSPLLMLGFVMMATVAGTAGIVQIKISENIKE